MPLKHQISNSKTPFLKTASHRHYQTPNQDLVILPKDRVSPRRSARNARPIISNPWPPTTRQTRRQEYPRAASLLDRCFKVSWRIIIILLLAYLAQSGVDSYTKNKEAIWREVNRKSEKLGGRFEGLKLKLVVGKMRFKEGWDGWDWKFHQPKKESGSRDPHPLGMFRKGRFRAIWKPPQDTKLISPTTAIITTTAVSTVTTTTTISKVKTTMELKISIASPAKSTTSFGFCQQIIPPNDLALPLSKENYGGFGLFINSATLIYSCPLLSLTPTHHKFISSIIKFKTLFEQNVSTRPPRAASLRTVIGKLLTRLADANRRKKTRQGILEQAGDLAVLKSKVQEEIERRGSASTELGSFHKRMRVAYQVNLRHSVCIASYHRVTGRLLLQDMKKFREEAEKYRIWIQDSLEEEQGFGESEVMGELVEMMERLRRVLMLEGVFRGFVEWQMGVMQRVDWRRAGKGDVKVEDLPDLGRFMRHIEVLELRIEERLGDFGEVLGKEI